MKKEISFFDKKTLKTGVRAKRGVGFIVTEEAKVEEIFYNGMASFNNLRRNDLDFEIIYNTDSKRNFMEKELKKAHEFLDTLEKAITCIPRSQKQTFFAGSILEDISKIIKRERHILDLRAGNFILKEELQIAKKLYSLEQKG